MTRAMRKRWTASRLPVAMIAGCGLAMLGLAGEAPAQGSPAGLVVAVTGGQVEGRGLAVGGAVFMGLPFAAPPVGSLRWVEPQPVVPWSGVHPAKDYANTCAQADSGWNKVAAQRGSEDCLYLNVWTPVWPAVGRKPVMVWIHGGANTGGSSMGAAAIEPPFDGESLSRHGVVVVTINYRLGIFGFVGHPELTAQSPHHASGGYGILDQVAALQWVHDNIARFGGDPANVTVFGQSAGGQDTSLLVASPLTRGLMAKAIVESGSPMIGDRKLQNPAQTAQLGVVLAQVLGAPQTGAIDYLRGLPTQQVLAAMPAFRKAMAEQHLMLDVAMDGYAVPEFTPKVYFDRREAHIPMIVGTVGRDSPGYRPLANPTPETTAAAIRTRVQAVYGQYPDLQAKALAFYGLDGATPPAEYAPYGALDLQANVDHGFRCEATAVQAWHNRVAPTYAYEFTAGNAAHPPGHSSELDFVFGYLRDQGEVPVLSRLSQQMQTYWTNFARTGDPNGPGVPTWSAYGTRRAYMEFSNQGPLTKADLRGGVCGVYRQKLDRDLQAPQ